MPISWWAEVFVSALLNALVIVLVLRRARGHFPFLLSFVVIEFIAIVVDSGAELHWGPSAKQYASLYWTLDMATHLAISLLILSLLWQALAGSPQRALSILAVAVGLLAFTVISASHFYSPNLNVWMNPLTRNLSFAEEALNLLLWTLLIRPEKYDNLLLFVSAGIGVQVTGEVIGYTLRIFSYAQSHNILWAPNVLVYFSEVLCLLTWIATFWKSPVSASSEGLPLPASPQPLH